MIDKVLLDLLFQHAQPAIKQYLKEINCQAQPLWAAFNKEGDYFLFVHLRMHKREHDDVPKNHCLMVDIVSKGEKVSVYSEKYFKQSVIDDPSLEEYDNFIGALRKDRKNFIWAE